MKKLLMTTLIVIATFVSAKEMPNVAKPIIIENVSNHDDFSPDRLWEYILYLKIKHPHIVYAQAVLETGNFKSIIFKENNNLFGMKYVHDFKGKKRSTVAIGSQYGHAKYKHWRQSVRDYYLWQLMFKKTPINTEKDYFKILIRYSESDNYIYVLKKIIEQNARK